MPLLATIWTFTVAIFNMIKIRLWPRLVPLIQPQRLFAALMIYSTSKTRTKSPPPIRKKSTLNSTPIGSINLSKRQYSTLNNNNNNNNNTNINQNNVNSLNNNNQKIINQSAIFQDSFMEKLFWNLSSQGPAFSVDPNNIDFIQEPNDFYNQLIQGVKRSTKRITLASLYLGTSSQEIDLVKELRNQCEKEPNLKVHILLDGLRGTRLGMVDGKKQSSATMLLDLYREFPKQVDVSLYHTPDLNGLLKKLLPPRVNETIGVNHIKTYVFDDDLLLSGANLSKDYFTNRQDRYVWVHNSVGVTSYFDSIVATLGEMSMKLDAKTGDAVVPRGKVNPWNESNLFKEMAYNKLAKLLKANQFYDESGREFSSPFDCQSNSKTWIFPTMQMGPFGIRQDEVVTSHIFESIPSDSKFYITSPYFNLTSTYLDLILRGKPKLDIITCSPEANGFHGAKGISGGVPDCYSLIEKKFLQKVEDSGNSKRIQVQEYIRNKWTYHGKGLWITAQKESLPSITLIGSPNFGSRSVEKDLEAQIILLTQDLKLQSKMESERKYLWTDTRKVNLNSLNQPDRAVSLWIKVLVYLFGNFL